MPELTYPFDDRDAIVTAAVASACIENDRHLHRAGR
jgi:hypothetical protein